MVWIHWTGVCALKNCFVAPEFAEISNEVMLEIVMEGAQILRSVEVSRKYIRLGSSSVSVVERGLLADGANRGELPVISVRMAPMLLEPSQ